MTTTSLMPPPKLQFLSNIGIPLVGGQIYTYAAGTTNLKATYTDAAGTTAQPNPIPLNARGEPTSAIYWNGSYRVDVRDALGNLVYTVDNYNTDPQGLLQLFTSAGSSLVGYIAAGASAVARWVQDKLRERVSILDFGADPTNTNDSADLIQAALNSFGSAGGTLYVPAGTYKCSKTITIPKRVTIKGDGRSTSTLQFTNTGDGLKSNWPINSSTAVWIAVRDIGITNTNAANTGAGFVDIGGSFVDLANVYIAGFMYEVIFDQTEIATISECEIVCPAFGKAGIWLVNGADHTVGASPGFTNRITVRGTQFNAANGAGPNIVDDGGGSHSIRDNNLNAGSLGIRAAGVGNLIVDGNECEGHTSNAILLTDTTAAIGQLGVAARYVGPCFAPRIVGNSITDGGLGTHIVIDDCQGGRISDNQFGQSLGQNILFNNGASCKASAVIIEGNSKLIRGPYRQAAPFLGGFSGPLRANMIRQTPVTYCANAQAAGTITVTPATMELIKPNTRLWAINEDGTNGEQVFVTATTNNTFTATFATSKAANFCLYGLNPGDQEEGAWTPTLFGSGTAGANTYSVQTGFYSRRGNLVFITANLIMTAKDAAMSGQLHIGGLPFLPAPASGVEMAPLTAWANGWTAAGYTQLNGNLVPNTGDVALLITGSGVALNALTVANISSVPFQVTVSGMYLTNAL